MKKKETEKKEDSPKIQQIIEELLKKGYEANDLKSYLKEKFHSRVDDSESELRKEKHEEWKKNPSVFRHCNHVSYPFCHVTMFEYPHSMIDHYILQEAKYWEIQEEIKKAFKGDKIPHWQVKIESLASEILWMALAFGVVLGEMVEITDRKGVEAIKNTIKEKGLVPYLPREKAA